MRAVTDYALNKKAIRHYMVEHDMSQKQLAKMCGTSPVTFSRDLNGHYKLPLRVLFSMATAMKMDVNDLVVKADECLPTTSAAIRRRRSVSYGIHRLRRVRVSKR